MESIYLLSGLISLALAVALGQNDVPTLVNFKKALTQDYAIKGLATWLPSRVNPKGCPQNWRGVTCVSGHVTAVALDSLGLSGADIFPVLSSLKFLRNLSLSDNLFTGPVSHIGSLESLQYLDLSHNMFQGEIPSGFSSLPLLTHVDLSNNKFFGNAMGFLVQLGEVVHVDLSGNSLSGSLDLGIANSRFVSSVEYLNVSRNSLEGVLFAHDGVPFFDSLTVFDASHNRLTGTIPPFQFLVSLQVLSLSSNMLSGSIPQLLLLQSSMVLSQLHFACNNLNGTLEIITSTTLKKVNVSSNFLSGSLPTSVGSCSVLDLSNNMFSGAIARMQNWTNEIEDIRLASNRLSGVLPNNTSPFYRLTSLNVSNNSLTGNLPQVLLTYPKLRTLDLSCNNLQGPIQSGFFVSPTLTDLDLSHNTLSGEISFAAETHNISLERLDLSHNALVGHMPDELQQLKNLACLNLSNNRLQGGVPSHLPRTIVVLDLAYNNLSGLLPDSLKRFPDASFHPGNQFLILPNIVGRSIRASNTRIAQLIVLLSIIGATAVVGITGLYCLFKRKKLDAGKESPLGKTTAKQSSVCFSSSSEDSLPKPTLMVSSSPNKVSAHLHLFEKSLSFTAEELSSAPAEVVGRSCHGTTYRVTLRQDRVLIVKWIAEGIAKEKKEFARELKKLADITHSNLLSYHGCFLGSNDHEKMILSSYVESRDLSFYLKASAEPSRMKPRLLTLDDRLRIAIAVSECLNHLHNERAIPHGNLKSSNVLIASSTMEPILTDYSLHRVLNASGTAEQVADADAQGYMPPEFGSSIRPSPSLKSDVYSFGVVLLELLTGRSTDHDLTDWARDNVKEGRLDECFDIDLIDVNRMDTIRGMLRVAIRCIMPASERPDIKTVFADLSSLVSK